MGHGNSFEYRTGFTLLEMIISIGIFSVLVVASIGVTIGVSNAQIKAANVQATQDNIRFGLELVTKEIRTGSAYETSSYGNACGGSSDGESPSSEISFITSAGERRVYYLAGTSIMRLVATADCTQAAPLLSDEVSVEHLRFEIGGEEPGPEDGQPWITVSLSVKSLSPKQALESRMDLQTTVVQRLRDL